MRWLRPVLFGLFLTILPAHAAEVDAPAGTLIEAEDPAPASTSRVVEDAEASGGKAVTSDKDWEPIFMHTLGEGTPERVTVHVRQKGGPVILKAVMEGGKQKELKSSFKKPAEYTWFNLGTYGREELGRSIRIIRGSGDRQPTVDAVVLSPAGGGGGAGAAEPQNADMPQDAGDAGITGDAAGAGSSMSGSGAIPPYRPAADAGTVDAAVEVDWSVERGQITGEHWGIALYHPVDGKADDDRAYLDFMVWARPGLVRLHRADQGRLWMNRDKASFDDGKPTWDVATIRRALAPVQAMRDRGVDVELMLCHGYWPTWFSKGKLIDADRFEQAAAITRELVEAVAETGVRVEHWELLNEAEQAYEKIDRLGEMFELFNVMAGAIRGADPQASVGGPAFSWANPIWVEPFLDACGEEIDFITWHNYAGGKPTVPNATLLNQVNKIVGHAAYVRRALMERGLDDVQTYLTEVNAQWTWKPFERRHANNVGAVFLASMVTRLADWGVTGITMWQDKGDAYGLIDGDDRMRATGQLYTLSRWMVGTRAEVVVDGDAVGGDGWLGIQVIPIVRADGGRSLVLINPLEVAVRLDASPESRSGLTTLMRIDADGLLVEVLPPAVGPGPAVELPGWSVTVLTDRQPGLALGRHDLPGQHVTFDW